MSPPTTRHILTFAQTLDGGGVERVQLRLAEDWLAAGRRVTLLLGCDAGPLAAELPRGLEVVPLGSPAYHRLYAAPRHVRALAPDAIFCPGNHYTSVAAWIRLRLGRGCPPIVAKASNIFVRSDQGRLTAAGYRLWLRLHPCFVDHLVVLSPALAAEARAMTGLPAGRVSVIVNPPARYAANPAPPTLPAGRFVLGVGRLEPQKRWDRLIAAVARIADREARLVILGEGSARAALEAQTVALGLDARVSLPGHALDPRPALARADIDPKRAAALAGRRDRGAPFAVAAVERQHGVALPEPQHVEQVVGAVAVERHLGARRQRPVDMKARRAEVVARHRDRAGFGQ